MVLVASLKYHVIKLDEVSLVKLIVKFNDYYDTRKPIGVLHQPSLDPRFSPSRLSLSLNPSLFSLSPSLHVGVNNMEVGRMLEAGPGLVKTSRKEKSAQFRLKHAVLADEDPQNWRCAVG